MRIISIRDLNEQEREQVVQLGGPGVELVCARQPDAARDAEVIYGWITPEWLAAAPSLRWVHLSSAGVEQALFPEMVAHPALLTNARGVAAVPIAEHAFA